MLCDLQIFSGKVYHPEPPHAQSLFLFPKVLVLISFIFSIGKQSWTVQDLIICLGSSITRRAARAILRESKQRVRIFGNRKCELIANFSATCNADLKKGGTGSGNGETKSANFWQGKV